MRVLWQEARDRIHERLAAAGFDDIRAEHFAVLQWPGPDGERPSALAARARVSRQAVNHLVGHLQTAGYLSRETVKSAGRQVRVVRLTPRGHAVVRQMEAAVADLEREWGQDIGDARLEKLRGIVVDLHASRQARASAAAARGSRPDA